MTRKVCLLVLLLIGIFKPVIAFTAGVEIDFNQAQCSKKGKYLDISYTTENWTNFKHSHCQLVEEIFQN